MNNKKITIIGISVIFVLFLASLFLCVYSLNSNKPEKEVIDYEYLIHYYYEGDLYDIKSYKDSNELKISKRTRMKCLVDGCSFPVVDEFTYEYRDNYKEEFNKLFNGRYSNEMTLYYDLLYREYRKVLDEIIGKGNYKEILYEEVNKDYYSRNYNSDVNIEQEEDSTLVTISMGMRNTGGYSIDVTKVEIDDYGTTLIYVKETTPGLRDNVTMALTYPSVTIRLLDKTDNIKVIDEATNEEYVGNKNMYKEKK